MVAPKFNDSESWAQSTDSSAGTSKYSTAQNLVDLLFSESITCNEFNKNMTKVSLDESKEEGRASGLPYFHF